MDQVFADPQVQHLGIAREVTHPRLGRVRLVGQPVHLSRADDALRSAGPDAGEHSAEILAELGYDAAAIEELRRGGVI
jgi:crotonobetainyl-CoA:carnitine CoA-transferase CaiB-like acyl-CoA transferase